VEREVARPAPPRLEASELLAGPAPEPPPPTDAELARERARYLAAAERAAAELEERWRRHPPAWNRPTGRAALDELVWFRYVETEGLPG
jgi:hypothetical protein